MTTLPPQPPQPPPAGPAPSGAAYPPPWWAYPPRKKSWGLRILLTIGIVFFVFSILLNLSMLAMLGGSMGAAQTLNETVIADGDRDQIVAVYAVEGTIADDAAAEFRKFVNTIKHNNNIKAVVLRVNSPGGTVSASDQIHNMVRQISQEHKLPVIVSMGGVAASGGYYISASADQIFVEPTTITGSIGVISVWPVLKGFLSNHGVEVVTIRSRQSEAFKAAENFWETPDDRTRRNVKDMLTAMHTKFEQVVRSGRPKLKTKQIEVAVTEGKEQKTVTEIEPLNGKVYLAQEAIEWGLADKIGYLADATDEAARQASLSNPRVVQYVKPRGLRELFGASEAYSSLPFIDKQAVEKLMTPQILMLWKAE